MNIPIIGKIIEKLIDRGGSIISELVTDKDLANKLDHAWKTMLSTQSHEFKVLEIEIEAEMFKAQQTTVQAELHQNDLYTKRTRPKIARQSWYITVGYTMVSILDSFIMNILKFTPEQIAASEVEFVWEIFVAIAAPALTYMGVREFGKWKNPGS